MTNRTSDKEGIRILTDVLAQHGVRRVVLSPGSRNAPLSMAFARDKRIEHYVILDERSAAFFALGMAQQSGEPVALACTSGTAPLNYGPAIAEAYYQRLPLIVITADRPVEWIDQEDSQTIRQYGLYNNIIKASYQLPAELREEDDKWYANRLVNDAINYALRGRKGPVHINVPLHEPLYGQQVYPKGRSRLVEYVDTTGCLTPERRDYFAQRFNASSRVMILAGFQLPNRRLQECLHRLAAFGQVVVVSETPANVGPEDHIGMIDRVLSTIPENEKAGFAPDLLITCGGSLISRQMKTFLRQYHPAEHWSIDRSEHPADTFKALTTQIDMEAADFFSQLEKQAVNRDSGYRALWQEKKKVSTVLHNRFARQVDWSDWLAFSLILKNIPAGTALQLANSTPIRYAQLFECPSLSRVDCNRGTSGIDGATSTAVGAACLNKGITLLITGDMGFIYDSNALWNKYISPRLKIIVMKNGGGGIFRFIPGPSELEELEECFETRMEVNVRGFAEIHHFRYFQAVSATELEQVLPDFFEVEDVPAILAIETSGVDNAGVLKEYFQKLRETGSAEIEKPLGSV